MGGPDFVSSVLGWGGGRLTPGFGRKLGGIHVRGGTFLPTILERAVKFQDGLQRDCTHVLPDGELPAIAAFFLIHPRAQLVYQWTCMPFFEISRGRFLQKHGPARPLSFLVNEADGYLRHRLLRLPRRLYCFLKLFLSRFDPRSVMSLANPHAVPK